MKNKWDKLSLKVLTLSIAIMIVASSVVVYSAIDAEEAMAEGGGGDTFTLMPPPFIAVAGAAEVEGGGRVAATGTSYLEDEAGISAYTNVEETIDLEDAKTAFRTIEHETEEYIIGSVPLPDYAETEDVHVYVHTDGWVVAYYLEAEPASKIVDWEDYSTAEIITGTKLEDGVSEVCNAAGVPIRNLKYYDFRYQNANRLMIVADAVWDSRGPDTFTIKLPSDFSFYERSFSHYFSGNSYDYSRMYIDEDQISELYSDEATDYGQLSATQLSLDTFHTISISLTAEADSFDAIVLVYREV